MILSCITLFIILKQLIDGVLKVSVRKTFVFVSVAAMFVCSAFATSNFEGLSLSPESSWAPGMSTTFSSGNATYNYNFTDWGGGVSSWDGITYSNETDVTTAGYTNDTSAYVSSPGSNTYGIVYLSDFAAEQARVQFDSVVANAGFSVANTTYGYLAMKDGNDAEAGVVTKFTESDWFKLTIYGWNGAASTGQVEFFLAQGTDIVDDWTFVDLSSLGNIDSLTFGLSSTDMGQWGMNTPSYFAIDNVVPEPATMLMFGLGAIGLARKRKA